MINFFRSLAKRALVRLVSGFYFSRSAHKIHHRDLEFMERYGTRVCSGPFREMQYVRSAICSCYLPKLIGSYESELHRVLEDAIAKNYDLVVDVGCAEGFYAVGMARRLPRATIHAHDTSYEARALCRQMAQLNGVADRVLVRGECTPQTLQKVLQTTANQRALVIADCEGYEKTLLNPQIAPLLKHCDILVELHDFIDPTISRVLEERFCGSHEIQLIDTQERKPEDYDVLSFWPRDAQEWALQEGRPTAMQWMWLQAQHDELI